MEKTAVKTELTDQELQEIINSVPTADSSQKADPENTAENEEVLCDEYGFPFEPEGFYNNAPLEFEEVTKDLWIVLNNLNYAATRYNRLSPYYPILMQQLEKDIKQMGSYCITKIVLEQNGEEFPDLDHVRVKELYRMVSVMFRKCCLAYNDLQSAENTQDMNIISWIFRWAALAERLKATQDRINKIKSGEIRIEPLLKKETVYKDEPRKQQDDSHRKVGPRLRASSLPILKSFTKEIKALKREEEKNERAAQRKAERTKKRYEKQMDRMTGRIEPKSIRPKPLPKIPELGINELELKKLLMDEAKSRGDMSEAGIIARENLNQLIERFKKLQEKPIEDAQGDGSPVLASRQEENRPRYASGRDPRSGPSDETRKKLREKRKKKR